MLSTQSFNALLKTLEEPPPHVKFLLATTDPQKLPVTVLSRCLQFNLKRLPVHADRRAPGADPRGRRHGLRSSRRCGCWRRPPTAACATALSLLDQLIAFGGGGVGGEPKRAPCSARSRAITWCASRELLAAARCRRAARLCARSSSSSRPTTRRCSMSWRRCWCASPSSRWPGDAEGDELYAPELLERSAASAGAGRCAALSTRPRLSGGAICRSLPTRALGFEMTLLRMLAFRPGGRDGQAVPLDAERAWRRRRRSDGQLPRRGQLPAPEGENSWAVDPQRPRSAGGGASAGEPLRAVGKARTGGAPRARSAQSVVAHARAGGEARAGAVAIFRRAGPARVRSHGGGRVETPAQAGHRASQQELEAARRALEGDPGAQALRERFGATLIPDTVRPLKS